MGRDVACLALILSLAGGCRARSQDVGQESSASASSKKPLAVAIEALGKGHVPATSPWASRAACQARLSEAQPQSPAANAVRIGTWNVRYFPDGSPTSSPELATDVEWLACALALLNVDLLAVQEFKDSDAARAAAASLIAQLRTLTGRDYALELARCQQRRLHRPGILYDRARVSLTKLKTRRELAQHERCSESSTVGLSAYVKLKAGPDFELLVIHAPAGKKSTEQRARREFWNRLTRSFGSAARELADQDVIVMGDFNTWGCVDCMPPFGSRDELRSVAERFAKTGLPLRLVPTSESCSFMLGRDAPMLDGFFVSTAMNELAQDARATVSGYCAVAHCRDTFPEAGAERALSDHCPLLLELPAQDLD